MLSFGVEVLFVLTSLLDERFGRGERVVFEQSWSYQLNMQICNLLPITCLEADQRMRRYSRVNVVGIVISAN